MLKKAVAIAFVAVHNNQANMAILPKDLTKGRRESTGPFFVHCAYISGAFPRGAHGKFHQLWRESHNHCWNQCATRNLLVQCSRVRKLSLS
jgi:hypothetical protein